MATDEQIRDIHATSLHGGHLALDFVNTVDWRLAPQRVDLLADHEVMTHWAHRLGLISARVTNALVARARRHPRKAQQALERATEIREALYRIFTAIAAHETARRDDLQALNAVFADAVSHGELVPTDHGFGWSWSKSEPWHRVLWAVGVAALELLSSGDLARVKQCHDDGCGWVFLDMSKNASRRWCSMQGCGTRAKMRRQQRKKSDSLR
ncbi:MAG: ABATE domain-containing protein [Actinomycetota bacterium]